MWKGILDMHSWNSSNGLLAAVCLRSSVICRQSTIKCYLQTVYDQVPATYSLWSSASMIKHHLQTVYDQTPSADCLRSNTICRLSTIKHHLQTVYDQTPSADCLRSNTICRLPMIEPITKFLIANLLFKNHHSMKVRHSSKDQHLIDLF